MRIFLAALTIATTLLMAPAAQAEPNAQLVASVQQRLNILGFSKVDAGTLSTPQISALHTKLQGNYTFGYRRIRTQQEVKVILGWKK